MKITIELEEDEDKAIRLLRCDDAFSLLWNILQDIRSVMESNDNLGIETHNTIKAISETIYESGLMDIYR